jgi:hypothetical protein
MLEAKPSRLGTHMDWIAITTATDGIISLAADGSLWYWPLQEGTDRYWDPQYIQPLLDISRNPQPLGNIFSVSN